MKWLKRELAYPGPYLSLCTTEKQFLKVAKHLNIKAPPKWVSEGANATVHTVSMKGGDICCVVCVQAGKLSKVQIYGTLVHEAVHVWQDYAAGIGETNPGSEQMAYAIQSISQELIQAYTDKKR